MLKKRKSNLDINLKVLITTTADNIFYFFVVLFSGKIRLDFSCELLNHSHEMSSLIFSKKMIIKKNQNCRWLQF